MIERYLVVLEDFMINEKLCILLNINEEFEDLHLLMIYI